MISDKTVGDRTRGNPLVRFIVGVLLFSFARAKYKKGKKNDKIIHASVISCVAVRRVNS